MHTLALQQVTNPYARTNADKTLHHPIALKFVRKFLSPELYAELDAACPNGVYVWGSKPEREHQTFKLLERKALMLFRRGRDIYKYGVILQKTINPALAQFLWGTDVDGGVWSTVYFFARVKDFRQSAEDANALLGRNRKDNWQGLVVKVMAPSEKVDAFFKKQLADLEAPDAGPGASGTC